MVMILVVCGAGASSTFLASRIRKLASDRGLDITAKAASTEDLGARLPEAGLLLVGPHLGSSFPALEAQAAELHIPASLLPLTAFGPTGAEDALATAITLVRTTLSTEGTLNA
jgi:PTS system cellobiose-specific IIB component